MEFSFDRSNAQPLGQNTQAKSPQEPAHSDGIDTSTIANERLRKAIEKNRARQAERNRNNPLSAKPQEEGSQQQASFFDQQAQQQSTQAAVNEQSIEQSHQNTQSVPPPRPRAQERAHATSSKAAATVVTRRSVARADEAEFTPVKRAPRKVTSQISYTTNSRKKSKPLDPTLVGYLVKGCWIFCAVMILRLIFANGGVTDFYSQRSLHSNRLSELDRIKKENMQLVHEIERMKNDTAYQKKLVRDNLGFIAEDEFLILFPKEKSDQ